eukprot:PLAT6991.1.p1 GENE.PLAT6991.1~~PLAT6991.1.p1  ORF type:complete len:615 (-),score=253.81 PLAT6991.1:79-1923(-)
MPNDTTVGGCRLRSVTDGMMDVIINGVMECPICSVSLALFAWFVLPPLLGVLFPPAVPHIEVPLEEFEAKDVIDVEPSAEMQLRDAARPGKLQCYDPATMQRLGEVEAMDAATVTAAVERARAAQVEWAKTSYKERKRVLLTLQDYITRHQDDIVRVACRDSGKTKVDALFGEVLTTCEKIRWVVSHGERVLAPEYRSTGPLMVHKSARVEYHPMGVLGIIVPWNYPFHNLMNHLASGLFAGNAVVCKVSEYASWSALYYTRMVAEALRVCGHNPELVQTVTGFGEAGAALIDAHVDKIIFTGSPAIGKLVMERASHHLIPCVLELGGKDPMILCDDADMSQIVDIALRGVYQNCGQNCIGVERVYAHAAMHDEFVDRAVAIVRKLRQGPPLTEDVDVGAMTMPQACDEIQALVDDAVAKGATVHCGGRRNPDLHGQFYLPTVLSGCTHDMNITNTEVFGPVMTILKWETEEDLLAQVHSIPYGLGSSVFSADYKRAERIGQRIRAGMTNLNDFGVNYLVQSLPFGGVSVSGYDRFAGDEGLRGCCLQKSVVTDRVPGIKTYIPAPLQYPTAVLAPLFCTGLINMTYHRSIWEKVKAIFALIKASTSKPATKTS